MIEETLSLDLSGVSLSVEDAKDLFNINDKDFARNYLLEKGATEKKEKIVVSNKKEIKPCYLGKQGEQYRKEAVDLIKNVIIDDPIKPGFKTGYRQAAILLNKNGYRTLREKRWTAKSVSNFWRNSTKHVDTTKTPSNTRSKPKAQSSTSTNLEIIREVIFSNLEEKVKLAIASILISNNP